MIHSKLSVLRSVRNLGAVAIAFTLLSGAGASVRAQQLEKLPPEYSTASWATAAAPAGESDYLTWFSAFNESVDPRFPDNVMKRYADPLAQGAYGEVLWALADEFRSATWPSQNDLRARFQARMDGLARAFEAAAADAAVHGVIATEAERAAVIQGLHDRGVGVQSLLPTKERPEGGDAGDFGLAFFAGDPDSRIDTYRIDEDGFYVLLVPPDAMRDLRLRAESVRRVLQDFVDPVQSRAYDVIRRADNGWTNYLENGYSQYPWESFLNGRLGGFSTFDPPKRQVILLHPTVGVEVTTASLEHMVADEVINLELLGFVGYYGAERQHLLGASIAAAIRSEGKPGIGVVFHGSNSFSAGVAWHDDDDDGAPFNDDPNVYLSFDLFRYVQNEGPRFKEEADRVRALLPR